MRSLEGRRSKPGGRGRGAHTRVGGGAGPQGHRVRLAIQGPGALSVVSGCRGQGREIGASRGEGEEIIPGARGIRCKRRGQRRDIEASRLWGCTRGTRHQVWVPGSREAARSHEGGEAGGAGAAGARERGQRLKRERERDARIGDGLDH